jgi:hypothetical protein
MLNARGPSASSCSISCRFSSCFFHVAALLSGALAAERRCPPLKAELRQAQQGYQHPQCAGVRGREASYAVRMPVIYDLQGVRFQNRDYACVAIKLP